MRKHNKTLRSILTGIISLCVAVAFVVCPEADPAFADMGGEPVKYAKKITVQYLPGYGNYFEIMMGKKAKKAKKIQITSSNKKVCKPDYETVFRAKKAGKATLTIKVTKKDGTVKTYKTKVKVLGYKNPFKEVKVNTDDWTSKFDKDTGYTKVYKKKEDLTVPLVVTPKKGWEVSKIKYEARYFGDDDDRPDIKRTIKSGDEITIYGKGTDYDVNIYITAKKPSTGQKLECYIWIDNGTI